MKYLDQYTTLRLLLRAAVVYAIKCHEFHFNISPYQGSDKPDKS